MESLIELREDRPPVDKFEFPEIKSKLFEIDFERRSKQVSMVVDNGDPTVENGVAVWTITIRPRKSTQATSLAFNDIKSLAPTMLAPWISQGYDWHRHIAKLSNRSGDLKFFGITDETADGLVKSIRKIIDHFESEAESTDPAFAERGFWKPPSEGLHPIRMIRQRGALDDTREEARNPWRRGGEYRVEDRGEEPR